MKFTQLHILLLVLLTNSSFGQSSVIDYGLEIQTIGTTNSEIPFWMRSNQNGSVPLDGVSSSLILRAGKEYNSDTNHLLDWKFGIEGRGNLGNGSSFSLIEGFAGLKVGPFELKAGRTKDVMGLNGDTTLTSGNFSVSGNALGIPKIEISIPEYYTIPIWDGLIAIRGTFAHGWLGKTPVSARVYRDYDVENSNPTTNRPRSFFHQKSLYGRLGKKDWKIKGFGGLNHQAFWGNERQFYGDAFDLSSLKTFFYVATGKAYGENGIARSKIGNQIGSIDLGLEYDFEKLKLIIYRQNFYDVGALAKLANLRDGLNGVTLENKSNSVENSIKWRKLLFEFLYTKNQAGEVWSKITKSGDEDYYNNYLYNQGWSYEGNGLGTPFITQKKDAKGGQPSFPQNYFINNRVVAFHFGTHFDAFKWQYITKISFSKNYGTYKTSEEGSSMGDIRTPPAYGIFQKVNQFSALFESRRFINNNLVIGYTVAIDSGELLKNSAGLGLKLTKVF